MAGRNDAAIAAALQAMAQAMGQQPNAGRNDGDFPEEPSTYFQRQI